MKTLTEPSRVEDEDQTDGHAVWPFPNQPLEHDPIYKLPFNPDNFEDAPI
jgi:hypothetical protein